MVTVQQIFLTCSVELDKGSKKLFDSKILRRVLAPVEQISDNGCKKKFQKRAAGSLDSEIKDPCKIFFSKGVIWTLHNSQLKFLLLRDHHFPTSVSSSPVVQWEFPLR